MEEVRDREGIPLCYEVRDREGKYFVRPPKTEYELQQEALAIERTKKSEDMPF
jgi:hypothetical protein